MGEAIRDHLCGEGVNQSEPLPADSFIQQPAVTGVKRWNLYSGLFILLKQKVCLLVSSGRSCTVLEALFARCSTLSEPLSQLQDLLSCRTVNWGKIWFVGPWANLQLIRESDRVCLFVQVLHTTVQCGVPCSVPVPKI